MADAIGWLSSMVLVWTIFVQLHRQWSAGTSEGVSIWLFIGQGAASVGFLIYSLLLANWVFVVTNGVTAVAAMVGIGIVQVHRYRETEGSPARSRP